MSLYKNVGIASLIMMASVFLSRVIGLFREMTVAYVGGTGGAVDAYQVAFILPEILNHIVASGFLSVTFIPIFSRYLAEDREAEGWHVFSVILTCFGTLLLLLIAVAALAAPALVRWVAPGLTDPLQFALAVRMTRIILPAQFFFFMGGLLTAVQFAQGRFAIPALAPLLYNIGIITGGLLLGPRLGMAGFSWGVLAGAFAGNFAVQIWGAYRAGMRFRLRFDIHHPDLKRYILLTLPLMIGLTMTFSTEFFLKFFGSYLPEGRIASLNYGLRIMLILVGLFGQAVGVGSFPFMARLVAEGRLTEMNRLLNTTLRYLSVVIPFSVLFMVLRYEVVRILFQRGQFDAAATAMTAGVLRFLMVGTIAFAAQTVVVRGYYAMQDTMFPALFGTVGVLLSLPLYWYGMKEMGVDGVALAVSCSAILQVWLLYTLWNRRTENFGSRSVYWLYLRVTIISGIIGGILAMVKPVVTVHLERISEQFAISASPVLAAGGQLLDPAGFAGSLFICGIIGLLFLGLLLLAGWGLRIQEIQEVLGRLGNKFSKRKEK